jgi:hypothetical protein
MRAEEFDDGDTDRIPENPALSELFGRGAVKGGIKCLWKNKAWR